MTTGAAARRTAEGEKVGSFLDAVRRPDSRPGRLVPAGPGSATPGSGEEREAPAPREEGGGIAGAGRVDAASPNATHPAARPGEPPAATPRMRRVGPAGGRETDTVIRTPASIEDVFAQLEAPWELRERAVVVRSYSMDPATVEMLKELHEMYGLDMSTLVRQAVTALYVEGKRRRSVPRG